MEIDYEENSAFPSSTSFMTPLVDMMLSAAEVLSAKEQAMTSANKL